MKFSPLLMTICICFLFALVFVVYSLVDDKHTLPYVHVDESHEVKGDKVEALQAKPNEDKLRPSEKISSGVDKRVNPSSTTQALPIQVVVLGIDKNKNITLLESESMVETYTLSDFIFKQAIQVKAIHVDKVTLTYNENVYDIPLFDANFLTQKEADAESNYKDLSSAEIANRPKILEHIIDLSDLQGISPHLYAKPGVSKRLFKQAGLVEGDIIMRINGTDVSDTRALSILAGQVHNMDSIKFEILRNGKPITQYLDIPSEDLSFSQ
ncbi:hypothetical protein [Agaribacter flavus]|uniref:General secretion pathway protein C n=1 Tax=Agaribacter flavus TaxID=1902781 RepID=A0ABV7FRM6_9ALTE